MQFLVRALGATPALVLALSASAQTADKASLYPAAAAGDGATTGGYNLSRWAEDWRTLCDPAKRVDPIDALKCVKLTPSGDVYVTFSGEARLRVNHTTNPNLRDSRAQRQDIVRLVGGADLHVGKHLRVYAEVAHGGIGGVELGAPAATLRNDVAVQQLFVEAKGRIADVDVGARYGRQEFVDGPNLLVSQRDNNTIRYTVNGLRAWARTGTMRIDAFDLKPTQYGDLGTEDDVIDPARRFSGVTLGFVVPKGWFGGSKLYVDPFFWRRRNKVGAWGGRVGPATRYYLGTHVFGEAGRVTIDWTVNHQWGQFRDQKIDAWHLLFAQNVRVGNGAGAPRLGFHADYASGGGGYGDGKLRNAYAPFGNNIYYSYGLFLTPSNLITVAPTFSVSPVPPLRLSGAVQRAWRANVHDAVYRASGAPFAGTQNVRDARIGDVLQLQAVWTLSPRLSLTGRYEHLAAGPSLTKAGYASADFLAGWLSFRF